MKALGLALLVGALVVLLVGDVRLWRRTQLLTTVVREGQHAADQALRNRIRAEGELNQLRAQPCAY